MKYPNTRSGKQRWRDVKRLQHAMAFNESHSGDMFSSFELVERILQPPQQPHHPWSHPVTILASALACWALFLLLQRTRLFMPRKQLNEEDELQWNIRTVATVHAVVLVIGAWMTLRESRGYTREGNILGYKAVPDIFCRIFLGYLLYDLGNLSSYYQTLKNATGIVHHIIFIYLAGYVIAYSIYPFCFAWLAFTEVSTPAINLRWRLAVMNKKRSRWYLWTGLVLMALFFVARVVLYGAGLVHVWGLRDVWLRKDMPWLHTSPVVIMFSGYVLNLYWFSIIVKAAHKALFTKRHQEASSIQETKKEE